MAKKVKKSGEAVAAAEVELQAGEGPESEEPEEREVNDRLLRANEDYGKEKTKKRKKDKSKVQATVSIAVPGSIIDNAQSLDLATRLAGQIARAATIFRVDEVVIFDDKNVSVDESFALTSNNSDEFESGAAFLVRILRYLETPQYLRKNLFPKHNSLRFVGMLPPLDASHHLRKHEWAPYREGITLKEKAPISMGTLVDVGLNKNIVIDQVLEHGQRVTVSMGWNRNLDDDVLHQIVSSSKPKEELGMYWGYKVRYASNISSVFSNCPYKGGYDYSIGTSEHGMAFDSSELTLRFRHLLIAFGGLAGLEECIEDDNNLKGKNARDVFNAYLNTCPDQGSRTIRTEEALFTCLQYFREPINRAIKRFKCQN